MYSLCTGSGTGNGREIVVWRPLSTAFSEKLEDIRVPQSFSISFRGESSGIMPMPSAGG